MAAHPANAKYPDTVAVAYDENNHKVTCVYSDRSLYLWDVRDIRKVRLLSTAVDLRGTLRQQLPPLPPSRILFANLKTNRFLLFENSAAVGQKFNRLNKSMNPLSEQVGKSHSFLYHSACIWGVESYPSLKEGMKGVLPSGSFITCSSDDTIRLWNLDANMGTNTIYRRNIYSNVRIL